MNIKGDSNDVRHGILRDDLWIKPVASYYSTSQIIQWLSCIKYDHTFTEQDVAARLFAANLDNLSTLMRLHMVTFPFESTAMH
jgi:hypothetical protein